MNNYEKREFVLRNKFRYLPIEKIIKKCFDSNLLEAHLAISELIRRNPLELAVPDAVLILIIKKMTVEQIYELVAENVDTPLCRLAGYELKAIFDYYERSNPEYYKKIMEDDNEKEFVKARKAFRLIKGNQK